MFQGFTIAALMVGVVLQIKNKAWVKPTGLEEFKDLQSAANVANVSAESEAKWENNSRYCHRLINCYSFSF